MASIFDIQDNLSAPSQSLYDKFLQQRQLLEQQRPDVAAQLPTIGANTPGQRMLETQQQAPVQDLASGLQGLVGQATQAVAGPNAKPKDQQAASSSINEVLGYLDPLKPKQTYGPDLGKAMGMPENSGGILGLGVQPIDVLAFAIGAAVTSRLPQNQAIAATMQIAGLPGQFRKSQEENARKFIQEKLGATNSQIADSNLQMRQIENAVKLNEIAQREGFISSLEQRLSRGQPLSEMEKQLYSIRAKRAGIDPNVIKEMFVKKDAASQLATLQEIKQLADQNNLGSVRGQIQLEGGGNVTVGGGTGSGRPLTAGEIADGITNRKQTDRLTEAGYNVTTPEGRVLAQKGLEERRVMEQQRLNVSVQNSARADRALEMIRPEESKKLTALQELHRGASDMLVKYDAALKSHGGAMTGDVQAAIQAATTSPEGFIGKSLQALGQRYPKLTQADLDFVARYASIQKFARGSLNDVGNLSNYERGIFQTMIGTPLDKPELFKSRTNTALIDAEKAYDQEYRSLGVTRNLSQFPSALGARQQPQQAPVKATHRFNPATGQVEEIK